MTDEMLERGKKLSKLAAVLQFTLPGIPCVYYGDEAGKTGCRDPFNRGAYPWDNADTELIDFYAKLGKLRKNPAFSGGEYIPYFSGLGYIVFTRKNGDNEVLVAVNRWHASERYRLPDEWKNATVYMGEKIDDELIIDGYGASILIK